MKYLFATNINGTGESGITDLETMKVLCLCTKENSEVLLQALNTSCVSGSLPITSNDHLNELIKAYNKDKYELIKFIEKVWHIGYNKGYWKGHSGQ